MDKKSALVKLKWRKTIKFDNVTIKNQDFDGNLERLDYLVSNSKKYMRDRFEQAKYEINLKANELSKLKGLKDSETNFIKLRKDEFLKEIELEEEKCLNEYQYTNTDLTNKYKKKLQYYRTNYENLIQRARNLNKVNFETLFDKKSSTKEFSDEKNSLKNEYESLKMELEHDLVEIKRILFLDRTVVYNKNTSQVGMRSSSTSSNNELQIGLNNLSASSSTLNVNNNLVMHNLDFGKIIIFDSFYDDFEFFLIKSFNFFYSKFGDLFQQFDMIHAEYIKLVEGKKKNSLGKSPARCNRTELSKFHFVVHLISKLVKKASRTYSSSFNPTQTSVSVAAAIKYLIRIDNRLINSELKKIDELNLKSLDIYSIHLNAFDYFSHITSLNLSCNHINTLPDKIFILLTELTCLDISHNDIIRLRRRVSFVYMGKLEHLNIESNKIESLKEEDFSRLVSLLTLNISSNFIRSISVESLVYLTSLRILILTDNHLEVIGNYMFQYLINLEELYLNRNKITDVKMKGFANLDKLVILDLSFNKIDFLNDFQFESLKNLTDLNLHSNQVSHLNSKTFIGLVSVKNLILSQNMIESIPDNLIVHMRDLNFMSLKGNPNLNTAELSLDLLVRYRQEYFDKCQKDLANNKNLSAKPAHTSKKVSFVEQPTSSNLKLEL